MHIAYSWDLPTHPISQRKCPGTICLGRNFQDMGLQGCRFLFWQGRGQTADRGSAMRVVPKGQGSDSNLRTRLISSQVWMADVISGSLTASATKGGDDSSCGCVWWGEGGGSQCSPSVSPTPPAVGHGVAPWYLSLPVRGPWPVAQPLSVPPHMAMCWY